MLLRLKFYDYKSTKKKKKKKKKKKERKRKEKNKTSLGMSCLRIDKISSLSCQKVAYSIISSEMGDNVAKQTSVVLRNKPEYIRRYTSTGKILINKTKSCTDRRSVVDKAINLLYKIKKIYIYYTWAYYQVNIFFSFVIFCSFPLCSGEEIRIYISPDICRYNF